MTVLGACASHRFIEKETLFDFIVLLYVFIRYCCFSFVTFAAERQIFMLLINNKSLYLHVCRLPELGSAGHRLGIIGDSRDLEPQSITLDKTTYTFGANTPTQTDIKWSPPANAGQFKSLTYNIEVDGGQGWATLTDSRLPILRVYFTSDKIIVGRYSRAQEAEPVAVRLRIRASGTIQCRTQEESVSGPWSEEIWLYIEGSSITSSTAV